MRVMTSLIVLFAVFALTGPALAQQPSVEIPGMGPKPRLPQPDRAASVVKFSRIIGWPEGRTPTAPEGFRVTLPSRAAWRARAGCTCCPTATCSLLKYEVTRNPTNPRPNVRA